MTQKTFWALWDLGAKQFVDISEDIPIPILFTSYDFAVTFRNAAGFDMVRYEIQEVTIQRWQNIRT